MDIEKHTLFLRVPRKALQFQAARLYTFLTAMNWYTLQLRREARHWISILSIPVFWEKKKASSALEKTVQLNHKLRAKKELVISIKISAYSVRRHT